MRHVLFFYIFSNSWWVDGRKHTIVLENENVGEGFQFAFFDDITTCINPIGISSIFFNTIREYCNLCIFLPMYIS